MRVVVSGGLLLLFIGSMAFITFPAFKQPLAIILIWFLAYMFLSGTSMLQILSFYPRVMSTAGSSAVNLSRAGSSYKIPRSLYSHRREGSTFQDGIASSTYEDGKIEDLVESRSSSHSSEPDTVDKNGQGTSLSSSKPLATKSASEVVDKATSDSDQKIVEDASASESYSAEEGERNISTKASSSSDSSSEDDASSASSQSSD